MMTIIIAFYHGAKNYRLSLVVIVGWPPPLK